MDWFHPELMPRVYKFGRALKTTLRRDNLIAIVKVEEADKLRNTVTTVSEGNEHQAQVGIAQRVKAAPNYTAYHLPLIAACAQKPLAAARVGKVP